MSLLCVVMKDKNSSGSRLFHFNLDYSSLQPLSCPYPDVQDALLAAKIFNNLVI